MNHVVPFCNTQRAVSLSLAEIIKKEKEGKHHSETPYATAFFRIMYGKSAPLRSDLNSLFHNAEQTVKDLKVELNRLLASNGCANVYLNNSFVEQAFPSRKTLNRFDNKFAMIHQRDTNVSRKLKSKVKSIEDSSLVELMGLTSKNISGWVRESEHLLTESKQHQMLSAWYNENAKNKGMKYEWLYSDMTPMQAAVDISYE